MAVRIGSADEGTRVGCRIGVCCGVACGGVEMDFILAERCDGPVSTHSFK
jgi:hypothetical protein